MRSRLKSVLNAVNLELFLRRINLETIFALGRYDFECIKFFSEYMDDSRCLIINFFI